MHLRFPKEREPKKKGRGRAQADKNISREFRYKKNLFYFPASRLNNCDRSSSPLTQDTEQTDKGFGPMGPIGSVASRSSSLATLCVSVPHVPAPIIYIRAICTVRSLSEWPLCRSRCLILRALHDAHSCCHYGASRKRTGGMCISKA